MMVLLLMFDASRRRRLADHCRAVSPEVQCIESSDEAGAALAIAPERIDLVILDSTFLQRPGAAHLVNWWRSVPSGGLVVLEPESTSDIEIVMPALLKALR